MLKPHPRPPRVDAGAAQVPPVAQVAIAVSPDRVTFHRAIVGGCRVSKSWRRHKSRCGRRRSRPHGRSTASTPQVAAALMMASPRRFFTSALLCSVGRGAPSDDD
jgi:hypothetical protein